MSTQQVLLDIDSRGIATLTLNRPEVHNAFDDNVINSLIMHLEAVAENPSVRVLVLRSEGKNFSAGADLNWMRRMAKNSHQENLVDARGLGRLMQCLNELPKPTVALVQGAAYGGAVGLAACCDLVIATQASQFCLSEVLTWFGRSASVKPAAISSPPKRSAQPRRRSGGWCMSSSKRINNSIRLKTA